MKKLISIALSLVVLSSASGIVFADEAVTTNDIELNTGLNNDAKETIVEKKQLITVDHKLDVRRISGKDRYGTALEISKYYFKGSNIVVVASGKDYIDALVGGSLISQIKVPLLLVNKDNVRNDVLQEIKRLNAKNVIILGGTNTVSNAVEKKFLSQGYNVERLAGENRYATAQKIAYARYYYNGANTSNPMGEQFVGINSKNYPDALIAGAIVGQIRGNILSYIVPNSTNLIPSNPFWLVFGGVNSVPKGPAEQKRVEGADRYETSVRGARMFEELTGTPLKTIILADGRNYPDALASSTIAGLKNATVVLTRNNRLPNSVINLLNEGNIDNVIIVGGENSVNKSIEDQLKNMVIKKQKEVVITPENSAKTSTEKIEDTTPAQQ